MDTLLPMTFPSRAYNWANDVSSGIKWSDIISEICQSNSECMMENKNGEVISLNGLFGTCFGIQPNVSRRNYHFRQMKDLLVRHKALSGAYVKRNGCLPHHASRLPLIPYQTINEPFAFPITGNLSGLDFNYCPEMVVRDVIRMWRELNDSLPGLSLTTPMFSDGYIDLDPSLIGPKFSIFNASIQLTRPHDDWYNRCYSSFIYLPEKI